MIKTDAMKKVHETHIVIWTFMNFVHKLMQPATLSTMKFYRRKDKRRARQMDMMR